MSLHFCIGFIANSIFFQPRRNPSPIVENAIYRDAVAPETGGKVPEAAHMRIELNKVDAMGFNDPHALRMVDALRDMPLPERVTPHGHAPHGHAPAPGPAPYSPYHPSSLRTGASSASFSMPDNFPDFSSDFKDEVDFDFPFNPAFDAHKLSAVTPTETHESLEASYDSGRGFDSNNKIDAKDIFDDKPHLYTSDPYNDYAPPSPYHPPEPSYHATPEPYHPPAPAYHEPEPYAPPTSSYHEPEPYHPPAPAYHEPEPYHPPAPAYHEPEPYHPPTSSYHEPEPYHPPSDYHAPSTGYGAPAYKPKGPVLLEKRPYEPKEIKPVVITTHDTYTKFDCRDKPYPDRHYADAEAGCAVNIIEKWAWPPLIFVCFQIYHYCHADGKQDTFHCPYGTIFNEYLGTCDHSGAVYCKGGEGYAGPPHHPKPHHPAPHGHAPSYGYSPAPYHPSPAPYHEPAYGHGHAGHSGFGFGPF